MPDIQVSPTNKLSDSLPPWRTMVTAVILVFLIWAFFSQRTLQFYASALFIFYSLTKSMWISVVILGIFQTLIMIPFRIVNITKSKHIKDFETTVKNEQNEEEQSFLIKTKTKSGNKIILYYLVNFMFNLTSYVSIGRLFLTDFYKQKLNPSLLYDFVPYPNYPIQDTWFKIPYIQFLEPRDYGLKTVLWVWLIMVLISFGLTLIQRLIKKNKLTLPKYQLPWITGSYLIILGVSYYLIRNFPTSLNFSILTADVSKPFPTLNLITALATFFTLFWLDIPPILKKGELAREANIDPSVIQRTQSRLFGESLRGAALIGGAAYFITNKIPCAFELSIFTLEIISWLSPLTLDRIILKTTTKA